MWEPSDVDITRPRVQSTDWRHPTAACKGVLTAIHMGRCDGKIGPWIMSCRSMARIWEQSALQLCTRCSLYAISQDVGGEAAFWLEQLEEDLSPFFKLKSALPSYF